MENAKTGKRRLQRIISTNPELNKLLAYYGSKLDIANAVGVTKGAITFWYSRNRVPIQRALELEKATKGHVSAVKLADHNNK